MLFFSFFPSSLIQKKKNNKNIYDNYYLSSSTIIRINVSYIHMTPIQQMKIKLEKVEFNKRSSFAFCYQIYLSFLWSFSFFTFCYQIYLGFLCQAFFSIYVLISASWYFNWCFNECFHLWCRASHMNVKNFRRIKYSFRYYFSAPGNGIENSVVAHGWKWKRNSRFGPQGIRLLKKMTFLSVA